MTARGLVPTAWTSLLVATLPSVLGTYLNVSGDLLLGALFPIHERGTAGDNCAGIRPEDGLQPLEAMIYSLGRINENPAVLPGIRLGALAFDTCDNPSYALEQAFRFVKGFIARDNEDRAEEYRCDDRSVPKFLDGSFDNVVAILGAQSSSVTIQVASVLALFSVPQISYMATSPFLSSKQKFPHFFRTVPSDVNQARAMLEVLRRFDWTYVSIVYSDTEYGYHGYETLVSLAGEYSVCFSAPHRIAADRFSEEDYENVVRTIAEKTDVRVVVLFAEKSATLRVLEAAGRLDHGSRFVWIGSDSWPGYSGSREPTNRPTETLLDGALAIQPLYGRLAGFDEYFTGLDLRHELVDPWFREFWREYHGCTDGRGEPANDSRADCADPSLRIEPSNGYSQLNSLHFVRDAVYSVAYALHEMQRDVCGEGYRGVCPEMRRRDRNLLSRYLGNVSFEDEEGKRFAFENSVDGPPRYSILNYRRVEDGSYEWIVVGNYTQDDEGRPVLQMDREAVRFRNGGRSIPRSACAGACPPDRVMVRAKQDPCCWRCQSCGLYRYKRDEQRCEECDRGTRPAVDGRSCEPIPEEFVDYGDPWALVAIAVALSGAALTAFVSTVFWLYRETPIVKASGRELSFVLLLGTLGCFLATFAIVAEPTVPSCTLARLCVGFCYALCYASLATKTNRIHRIFNEPARSPRKRRFTSPRSQLAITALLASIELVLDVAWLLELPTGVTRSYPTREHNVKICRGSEDGSYVLALAYPFLLTVACTFYAIKTRKCPEGFNETRRIAFANYATMILWLAFVPLYLASTNNVVRVITLALSLSLNGLVQLVCLFLPKVYLILVRPEKNTRELVMARHGTSSCPTTPATPEILPRETSPLETVDPPFPVLPAFGAELP